MTVTLFLLGCLSSIRIMIGYNYLVELMPKRYQTLTGTCWCLLEAFIPFMCALYFWQVSKEWLYVFLVGYAMQLFGLVAVFVLPESPNLSLEMGRLNELQATLEMVARWNRKKLEWDASPPPQPIEL